jgi:hypothetical protein
MPMPETEHGQVQSLNLKLTAFSLLNTNIKTQHSHMAEHDTYLTKYGVLELFFM